MLKDIIPREFKCQVSLQRRVKHSTHVRTAVDTILDRYLLVFPYLETNLLLVDTPTIAPAVKKKLLKDALSGLADLHDQRIIHTGLPVPPALPEPRCEC